MDAAPGGRGFHRAIARIGPARLCSTTIADRRSRRITPIRPAPADKFATVAGRLEHQDELDAGIEAWSMTLGKYELTERCQAAGVRALPVQSAEDRVEHDPQLRERGV